MKYARLKAALTVLIAASLPLAATSAKAADAHAADSAAIQQLFADLNRQFNDHDAQALAALFVDDADFITIGGTLVHGSAQIEQHMAPLYAGRLKAIHRDASLRGIRFLRPDTATVDGDIETTGLIGADGAAVPPAKGLYDLIVMKRSGRWRVVVWHESNFPVSAPPAR